MNRTLMKSAAGLAVFALLGAACGNDDTGTATTGSPTPTEQTDDTGGDADPAGDVDGAATDSGAAELRSGLTALLQEHVYLAGVAINQAVADGGDLEAPATVNAVETLDANSVALSEAIAGVYGDEAGEQFLAQWRDHIGFFVDYTLGGATGDQAMQDEAKANLDEYRADFGAFIESATDGNLDAGTVADELQVHVNTLVEAVDAILAGDPEVYSKLQTAAAHMPGVAAALAGAIAEQNPDLFAG
jgi:hypothetical protein